MKKRITLIVALCLCLTVLCSALVACAKKDAPTPEEGVIYQTDTEKFWAGVGSGYMTFEYIAEPETKEEGKLYGNVFKVYAYNDEAWQAWLSGTWTLSEDTNILTLLANWDGDNATSLTDATSGVAKTYTKSGNAFSIGVSYPGGSTGKVTFTLDIVKNKVGSDNSEPSKPSPEPTPSPATVQLTLEDSDTVSAGGYDINADGKLELLTDNTWKLSISYDNKANYTETASGTWAMAQDYSKIILTITKDEASVFGTTTTVDMAVNAQDQTNILYTATMNITVPQVGTLEFVFTNVPAKTIQLTMTADSGAGQKAKIDVYDDGTWILSISYYADNYVETASGTWAANGYTSMTLTVTKDEASVMNSQTYTVPFDYATTPGSIIYTTEVACTIPQVGTLTFNFSATLEIPQ